MLFTGALVAIITDSQMFGIIAAVLNMVIIMVIADYTAPALEKLMDLREFLCRMDSVELMCLLHGSSIR